MPKKEMKEKALIEHYFNKGKISFLQRQIKKNVIHYSLQYYENVSLFITT
jgi:hypothetical protein